MPTQTSQFRRGDRCPWDNDPTCHFHSSRNGVDFFCAPRSGSGWSGDTHWQAFRDGQPCGWFWRGAGRDANNRPTTGGFRRWQDAVAGPRS